MKKDFAILSSVLHSSISFSLSKPLLISRQTISRRICPCCIMRHFSTSQLRSPYLLALLTTIIVVLSNELFLVNSFELNCQQSSSASRIHWRVERHEDGQGSIGLIGDVTDVLEGRVTDHTRNREWDLSTFGSLGLGAAGIANSLNDVGEAVFVGGRAFVRSTDNASFNYFSTVFSPRFRSPFSVIILNGCTPDVTISFKETPMTLEQFYSRLSETVGGVPFCYAGLGQYAELNAIAISKAPIYGEPLFGNIAQSYYSQPNFNLRPGPLALTVGCVANFSSSTVTNDPALQTKLRKLLYLNPLDESSSNRAQQQQQLHSHSHALSLRRCYEEPGEVEADAVDEVFHMLSTSLIQSMKLQVYKLDRSERLLELLLNGGGQTSEGQQCQGRLCSHAPQ